jgi:hypothetical protein
VLTKRTDLNLNRALTWVHGTKNEKRDRPDVIIEEWALPYLREHCLTLIGDTRVWPTLTRDKAHHHHQSVCHALGIKDYTLRDSRHSWAVRARKRGESFEAIAAQLGNSVEMVAKVYAKYKPELEERTTRRDVLGVG